MRISTVWIALILILSCKEDATDRLVKNYQVIKGETMGTYYLIKYDGNDSYKSEVDSILYEINNQLSTYIDTSLISQFNKNPSIETQSIHSRHLLLNLEIADSLFNATRGSYDPTVMPLVNYWGFGYDGRHQIAKVDTQAVANMMAYIGFDNIEWDYHKYGSLAVYKKAMGVELDFSASAKGYAVDQIAELLQQKGIHNLFVDIGGEQVIKGVNNRAEAWSIGINTPMEDGSLDDIALIISSENLAIASSGNYRNFYETNGVKYSHTINPKTGYPERSTLLAVTVVAPACAYADGYATACMVLGVEEGYQLIESLEGVEALFFVNEQDSLRHRMTSAFSKYIKQP